jgi:hypothetical protein
VIWVKTAKGKNMPLDIEVKTHEANGRNLVLFRIQDGVAVHTGGLGHESHHATCPDAERFRAKK